MLWFQVTVETLVRICIDIYIQGNESLHTGYKLTLNYEFGVS